MVTDDRDLMSASFTRSVRLWHIGLVIAVVVALEVWTGLPGIWLIVYPIAFVLSALVAYAIYDREGGTVLKRSETQHGNDMPADERAQVAADLLASLDEEREETEEATSPWAAEIERRARQVLDGQSSGEDWDTARDRIAGQLRSR